MPRYSPEFKARAVELFNEGFTYRQALEITVGEFGGPMPNLRTMQDRVNISESPVLNVEVDTPSRPLSNTHMPAEVIGTAVAMRLVFGLSYKDISRQFRVSNVPPLMWTRNFGPTPEQAASMTFEEVKLLVMDNVRKHRRERREKQKKPTAFGFVTENFEPFPQSDRSPRTHF
ncbi:hypothetical protein ACL1I0_02255 [Corynebacterium striatum]